jgi:hypothetical protein
MKADKAGHVVPVGMSVGFVPLGAHTATISAAEMQLRLVITGAHICIGRVYKCNVCNVLLYYILLPSK